MNGEGFAFAAWIRASIATGDLLGISMHGWDCWLCRRGWNRLQGLPDSAERTGADTP